MNANSTAAVPDSLEDKDRLLAAMFKRVQEIAAGPLSDGALVELTSIYNNVAYIFLYLEANIEYIDYSRLLPWRHCFHNDSELDKSLLSRLHDLHSDDPDIVDSRDRFISQLEEKQHSSTVHSERIISLCTVEECCFSSS